MGRSPVPEKNSAVAGLLGFSKAQAETELLHSPEEN